MSGKGGKKCPYGECYLPDNNNKYWLQLAYLSISVLILIKDETAFTFFSLLMFTAPILLDLTSTKLNGKVYNVLNKIYILLNSVIAVFCFSGMFGLFVDNGTAFALSEGTILSAEMSMEKRYLLIPLVLDLIIPIIMHNACPSKNSKEIIEIVRQQGKVGNV